VWRVSAILRADRGLWLQYKRGDQTLLPDSDRRAHSSPDSSEPTNYVDIDPEKKDIFGIPQLRFHFQWGENELLDVATLQAGDDGYVQGDGRRTVGMDDEPNRPGTSLHETAVCRFGNDPKTSVTNKWGKLTTFRICISVTAAFFRTAPTRRPPMPIIAFAMRNCDHMLENFKKGVHQRA